MEDIEKAAEIAQAKEFIDALDDGYDAKVEQGGKNFSGGQKQRLSIARAVIKKPKIFVFDDSFSALDFKTDSALRTALKEEVKDATVFIVAQRIGTIMDADQIIVLQEGKMVGLGKHEDLIKNCDVYKEIALSQLDEEEIR
jgi:ATP-binding cassette subfamily B protein